MGVCFSCGYEDLNDHDQLRNGPMFALAPGKADPGAGPLAARSTLNRLELSPADATGDSRYKQVVYNDEAISGVFVDGLLNGHERQLGRQSSETRHRGRAEVAINAPRHR